MSTPVDPSALPLVSDLAKALLAHVRLLASPDLSGRRAGTEGNRKAEAYLVEWFQEAGLEPLPSLRGYRQPLSGNLGHNVLGMRRASGPTGPAPWLVLGAHFDHLGSPYLGADDNASAVSILIETARRLPPLVHHHLLVIAFNAEEPPYIRTPLMGSQQFVDRLPAELATTAQLKAVIVMDLMGGVHWAPIQHTIFAAGVEQSPQLYHRIKASGLFELGDRALAASSSPLVPPPLAVAPVGLHLIEQLPLIGPVPVSDYDAFRNRGVPFVFLSSGRTPRYHRPSDLPDTLYYERMAKTVGWLERLLQLLDEDTLPYRFEANRLEVADEITVLRALADLAAREESEIPGTSFLVRWRMKADAHWLHTLDPNRITSGDIRQLERIALRIQGLLANVPASVLL
jgi:hypothetical protein